MMRADSLPDLDVRAARLKAIHDDADELSALSMSLQSGLQQLQQGHTARRSYSKLQEGGETFKEVGA
jgi:hypothetical protein